MRAASGGCRGLRVAGTQGSPQSALNPEPWRRRMQVADMLDLPFKDASFDVILEKGAPNPRFRPKPSSPEP